MVMSPRRVSRVIFLDCTVGIFSKEFLLAQFVCYGAELVVPLLSEAADEGFAQETIDGQTKFAAFPTGATANAPTVDVDTYKTVGQALFSNGVEGATPCLSITACALAASRGQAASNAFSTSAISSCSKGAPLSPSMQQAPPQAVRSQQKHSVNTSGETMTSPTCTIGSMGLL